ncbi:MAG: cell division protein FtsX [Paracoccaceae bacterium]
MNLSRLFLGDRQAGRIVPPSGPSAWLTLFTAAAMAFLSVFALATALAAGRLAERWSAALSGRATIQLSVAPELVEAQTQRVLDILSVTPGIATARALDPAETRALLAPWFGSDLPLDSLTLPQLIDIEESGGEFDAEGLRLRLAAEVPEAILDDHQRWRRPLVAAANWIRGFAGLSVVLIGGATAAMITLAAEAALAANAQVIGVLRLIGARDAYIVRAFVRRFTLRALAGAGIGAVAGMVAVAALPAASEEAGFLSGLGFSGWQWLWPLAIPPLAAIIGFVATRAAAVRTLRRVQ